MYSSLMGLVIAAILASAAPRTPAADDAAHDPARVEALARQQYEADKSRCRSTAAGDAAACVREARARYRAARDAR